MSLLLEPSPAQIESEKVYAEMGLSPAEFDMVKKILGRLPNYTEIGLFSVMWSEHCSYKNSKPVLKKFPITGEKVLQGPGEGQLRHRHLLLQRHRGGGAEHRHQAPDGERQSRGQAFRHAGQGHVPG